jgi:pantoate--beta-alanine ligase
VQARPSAIHSMEIIRTVAWMREKAQQARLEQRVIGFVPTMGALHAGHIALVERARRDCSPVYASIFLNPKQFGPQEDLSKYPRPLELDVEKLTAERTDGLFLPDSVEMYPPGFSTYVHVDGLSERLEGKTRPGHFRGVSTVVLKLLEIVQPHYVYFGRKDAQQVRIVQQMVRDLNLLTEIVVCPIVREADGLAMSSRNAYLGEEDRKAATILYRALRAAEEEVNAGLRDSLQLQSILLKLIASEPRARLDYAEIVDAETFEPVVRVTRQSYVVLAVFFGRTRLIDNMLIEPVDEEFRTDV